MNIANIEAEALAPYFAGDRVMVSLLRHIPGYGKEHLVYKLFPICRCERSAFTFWRWDLVNRIVRHLSHVVFYEERNLG
jgi:hypothetical protein